MLGVTRYTSPMTALAAKTMTVEEYLESERHSEIRHEYVDGTLLPMPGASREHSRIVKNIVKALDDIAEAKGCELHPVEVMTRVQNTRYRYPDIVISCNPGTDKYFLQNPCFIAEITSDSTADTDHGKKLEEYTKLPSLERYAIISQAERFVIVYKPVNGAWTFETFSEAGEFEIPCLETTLSLDQIYANVAFG
jgi:Uma2 family endonuclease